MNNTNLKIILTKKFLQNEYIKKRKTCQQLSKEINCSSASILNYLKKFNMKVRTMSEIMTGKKGYWTGKKMSKEHRRKISEGEKGKKLSDETKKKISISRLGKRHPKWKGRWKSGEGYIFIHVRNHPFCIKNNYILEHRLVMEAYLNKISLKKWIKYGRKGNYPKNVLFLTKKEVVHHINGIRDDNEIKNLMLFPNSSAHHKFIHINEKTFICKFCNKNQKEKS